MRFIDTMAKVDRVELRTYPVDKGGEKWG